MAVVPFPFSERPGTKRRPALVLMSLRRFNEAGSSVLSMITTKTHSPWPGDVAIDRLQSAGLPRPCIVRHKLFALDNRLILHRAGSLSEDDRTSLPPRPLMAHLDSEKTP